LNEYDEKYDENIDRVPKQLYYLTSKASSRL